MIELSKYIYENYPELKNKIQYWQLLSLLDKNEDKIICIRDNDNKIKGIGIYVKISDDLLEDFKLLSDIYGREEMIDFISEPVFQTALFTEKGENVHFFILVAEGFDTIRRGLREVIKKENPTAISWIDIKDYKLKIFRRREKLCLN